jgi:hypothetical protein
MHGAARWLLVVAALAPSAVGRAQTAEPPDPARLRAGWERLDAGARREAVEWLRHELSTRASFQRTLIEHVKERQERDPGLWPPVAPTPVFDPARHAPRQPIARRPLASDHPDVAKARAEFRLGRPERALARGWTYDWASGELRRAPDLEDPERQFANALHGYAPDLDLARALVLRELDRGEEQKALAAFAHAYTDRAGRVYEGITLYDAWGSGRTIEMPDVDSLGIVHDVLDEWRRWVAPVPASRHDALYERIGELYLDARRYRGLREALADLYLIGEPAELGTYETSRTRLHALWDHHRSDPAELAAELPDAKRWEAYLRDWNKRCLRDSKLVAAGRTREATLAADARAVTATLAWVLGELGAFEEPATPRAPRRDR